MRMVLTIKLDHASVPKVADFGFARVLANSNAAVSVNWDIGPIRWMVGVSESLSYVRKAPESLKFKQYSEKVHLVAY